jgi:hypothetical protein
MKTHTHTKQQTTNNKKVRIITDSARKLNFSYMRRIGYDEDDDDDGQTSRWIDGWLDRHMDRHKQTSY